VILDYSRKRMILEKNARHAEPSTFDMSGLTLMTEGQDFGVVRVHDVAEASPAAQAGVRPGDTIVTIDGRAIKEMGLEPLFGRFREEGRELRLGLLRDGKPVEVTMRLRRRI
jgi:C-terminal processing protease CtpA/Prc